MVVEGIVCDYNDCMYCTVLVNVNLCVWLVPYCVTQRLQLFLTEIIVQDEALAITKKEERKKYVYYTHCCLYC